MIKDRIDLTIPSKADYISIVRLATSGIANNLNLTIDEIEDIKVCVGEACNNALNISRQENIRVSFTLTDKELLILVDGVKEEVTEDLEDAREAELGFLIIKSLMDEVSFSSQGIKMIKYIE